MTNIWLPRICALGLASCFWTLVFFLMSITMPNLPRHKIGIATSGDTASIVKAVEKLNRSDIQISISPDNKFMPSSYFNAIPLFFAFCLLVGSFTSTYYIARNSTKNWFGSKTD